MEKENQEEMLDEVLEQIAPSRDEVINRRINHVNFARTIIWLSIKSRNNDFVYASELSEFIKVSLARTHQILNELVKIKVLKKKFPTSNLVEFWFEYEDDVAIVTKYFDRAKKTLGVELKLTLKPKE